MLELKTFIILPSRDDLLLTTVTDSQAVCEKSRLKILGEMSCSVELWC